MRALILLPSYNESLNIVSLIDALLGLAPDIAVCVVDDSSPDGTGGIVEQACRDKVSWRDRVHLITRAKKDGRGGAVRAGLSWGKGSGRDFQAYVEMDCDFSHEPPAVSTGLQLLEAGNDVVIGARYPKGTIIGWPATRRIFSFLANGLARALIDSSIADYTNGFRFYSPRAVDVLLAHPQRHKGYIYLSETLSVLLQARMKIATFPIRFQNRERGVSNTNLAEIRSSLKGILAIAWTHRFPR